MGRKKQYARRKKGWPIPKDDENEIPFYEPTSTFFTLKVHHKGTIDYTLNVPTSYNGGVVEYVHWLDLKYMSMFELELIARDLAYESEATFPTVVELGDVGKDAGPNLDDENVTPIKEVEQKKEKVQKEKLPELPEFRPETDMGKAIFVLEISFASGKLFKQEIREYALREGKDIFFKKNDPHRVRAQCKGVNCRWMCYAFKIDDSPTFVIKSYEAEHKCCRTNSNRWATAQWLSAKYREEFKVNENLGVSSFQKKVNKDHVLEISRHKAYRARLLATKSIEGSYEEQYAALWDYAEEIKYTNKGSTIEFLTENAENGVPRFKRMYLCYSGLREGFNEGCRPIIGLDGCHIKGVQGQLLTTIGVDGNNQMFPIAFAAVEIENKDSWSWFLNLLRVDLKIENSNHWTFITDKQKGLEQSLKGMWDEGVPEAEHRHCARHLEKNFIKVFKDKTLKDLLWKAAREPTIRRFEGAMEEIKKISNEAYEWLMAAGPSQWSRSHFRTHPKCDILLNNMCEGFNGTRSILVARERPIFSMLERIRMYLMQRMTKHRQSVLMWDSNISPKAVQIIEKNKEEAGSHLPTKSGELIYQIHNMYGNIYSVDLRSWVCSCRRWELTGIPCSHVVIFPIRIQDEWPRSGKIGMINPIHKKQPGRPKKSRKLELQELVSGKKLKKKFVIIKCSVCGGKGHNLRTCGSNKTTSIAIYGLENTERVSTISFLIELFLTKYSIVAYSGKINLMPVNDSSKALHVQDMNVVVQAEGEDPKQWRREFVAGGKLGSRPIDGGVTALSELDAGSVPLRWWMGVVGSRGWVWVRVGGVWVRVGGFM
uniref:SWIM-type domain-containing protein n=1 Tax=Cannabis sativa TaxID=3483 RepID=A0A803PQG0_CANSA